MSKKSFIALVVCGILLLCVGLVGITKCVNNARNTVSNKNNSSKNMGDTSSKESTKSNYNKNYLTDTLSDSLSEIVEDSSNTKKEITSIKFNNSDDIKVEVGYFGYNFVFVQGSGYDDYRNDIEFISTNPEVATIKSDGKSDNSIWCRMEAISVGTTTFYAQTKDGKLKTDKITVTVLSKEEASRLAEESQKAEEAKRAEESQKEEQSRKAEESRLAEESRKAEESRTAEEKKNTLYNAKNIKIVYKEISENSYDKLINLYIENNSSEDITVQVRDFSINGYMIDPTFSSTIAAGKKINDEIRIDKDDLDKNLIDKIKDVELKFFVFIGDDWSGHFETETIKFSV